MPRSTDFIDSGAFGGPAGAGASGLNPAGVALGNPTIPLLVTAKTANDTLNTALGGLDVLWFGGGQLASALAGTGNAPLSASTSAAGDTADIPPGMTGLSSNITYTDGQSLNTPTPLTAASLALTGLGTFSYYWTQGTDATLRLIESALRWEQYALQYQSHCYYTGWSDSVIGEVRRLIQDGIYLDSQIQDFGTTQRINNLFRNKSVAVQTTVPFLPPTGDNTKFTVRGANASGNLLSWKTQDVANKLIPSNAVSYYGALKNRILNQYGQIGGVRQIPINSCLESTTSNIFPFTSSVMFGGDTYVTRYTEKNTMFFFYDWLYNQPNGFEFNYHLKKNIPVPTYWMDTKTWDVSDFIQGLGTAFTGGGWGSLLPEGLHCFDRNGTVSDGLFGIKDAYMYLFNSGVRDFYVESEVNTDLRDWGDNIQQRFYDPFRYTDLKGMFDANPTIIKDGEVFKYDYSLSISKAFTQQFSWANIQPINYDPFIYESCYVHNPNLVIYSLPSTDITSQQAQLIKDNWTVYLANNYKYFQTPVSSIKSINKSGALFFFGTRSPQQLLGVENLKLGGGSEVTVGTGALFSQPLQNLSSSDNPYEYGSCQNRLSVANTPMGLFWMSQSSGKIFQLQEGIQEISMTDLKWWFAQYLPYQLTQQFPNFALVDNPVIGIGCQTIFDNENTLVYFSKRDYKLLPAYVPVNLNTIIPVISGVAVNGVQYTGANTFLVGGLNPIILGDPLYFEDASWTALFDPKTREWVSFQDWHPELTLPGKNTFMTTQTNPTTGQGGIWLHNDRADLYCNVYGKDVPFEVEFRVVTGQQENTIKSVQVIMENYLYAANEHDRYLMLDYFFDKGVVFNNEQCSGLLKFNPILYNDPWAELGFPVYNINSVDILYSRVENRYRFNQFSDLVDDRGEFSAARRMIWNTGANGYVKTLNAPNLNYAKDPEQRKRFRGYNNSVWLRKDIVGNVKILVILSDLKLQNSPR
jgi:hypothetical protein